jgi:hypothetical protein
MIENLIKNKHRNSQKTGEEICEFSQAMIKILSFIGFKLKKREN